MNVLKRLVARVSTVPTRGAGCALILFMSGIAVLLPVVAALSPGSPA